MLSLYDLRHLEYLILYVTPLFSLDKGIGALFDQPREGASVTTNVVTIQC